MDPTTHRTSRREFLVGGALIGTAVVSGVIARAAPPPSQHVDAYLSKVPAHVDAWRHVPNSSILIPQGEVGSEEVYDRVVTRHYEGETLPAVMLLIAYGQAQGGSTQLHRPELCYPAAGFQIAEHPDIVLPTPSGNAFAARNLTGSAPGRTEQILYWTRVGIEFPASGFAQRWSVLRQTLAGGAPDGILVRMSTIEPDPVAGVAVLRRFSSALMDASSDGVRRLLWGPA